MRVTKDEIIKVLEQLEEEYGYVFETNFECCTTCATSALYQKYGDAERWIYWHEQNEEAFEFNYGKKLHSKLYLGWGGNGEEIVEAFENAGIATEWNGSKMDKIAILPEKIEEGETETENRSAVEELREIRDGGQFNMIMDRAQIMQYANENNMFSLVSYCGNSREKYMELLKQI